MLINNRIIKNKIIIKFLLLFIINKIIMKKNINVNKI